MDKEELSNYYYNIVSVALESERDLEVRVGKATDSRDGPPSGRAAAY